MKRKCKYIEDCPAGIKKICKFKAPLGRVFPFYLHSPDGKYEMITVHLRWPCDSDGKYIKNPREIQRLLSLGWRFSYKKDKNREQIFQYNLEKEEIIDLVKEYKEKEKKQKEDNTHKENTEKKQEKKNKKGRGEKTKKEKNSLEKEKNDKKDTLKKSDKKNEEKTEKNGKNSKKHEKETKKSEKNKEDGKKYKENEKKEENKEDEIKKENKENKKKDKKEARKEKYNKNNKTQEKEDKKHSSEEEKEDKKHEKKEEKKDKEYEKKEEKKDKEHKEKEEKKDKEHKEKEEKKDKEDEKKEEKDKKKNKKKEKRGRETRREKEARLEREREEMLAKKEKKWKEKKNEKQLRGPIIPLSESRKRISETPVFYPPELEESEYIKKWASAAAEELCGFLLGRGNPKEEEKIEVFKLIKALEMGEDVSKYLYLDQEIENDMKILITPDVSGSTCDWSKTSGAFGRYIAKHPRLDAYYVLNANGALLVEEPSFNKMNFYVDFRNFDCVVYLGDYDGYNTFKGINRKYQHLKIFYLTNYNCNNYLEPVINKKDSRRNFIVVDGIQGQYAEDLYRGIKKAKEGFIEKGA